MPLIIFLKNKCLLFAFNILKWYPTRHFILRNTTLKKNLYISSSTEVSVYATNLYRQRTTCRSRGYFAKLVHVILLYISIIYTKNRGFPILPCFSTYTLYFEEKKRKSRSRGKKDDDDRSRQIAFMLMLFSLGVLYRKVETAAAAQRSVLYNGAHCFFFTLLFVFFFFFLNQHIDRIEGEKKRKSFLTKRTRSLDKKSTQIKEMVFFFTLWYNFSFSIYSTNPRKCTYINFIYYFFPHVSQLRNSNTNPHKIIKGYAFVWEFAFFL